MSRLKAEILSFTAVGACVSVVFATMAYGAAKLEVAPDWANVIAYGATTPIAYWGQSRLTFKSTRGIGVTLPRFVIAIAAVSAAIHGLGRIWPSGEADAGLAFLSWALLTVGNFMAFKFWVFRDARSGTTSDGHD